MPIGEFPSPEVDFVEEQKSPERVELTRRVPPTANTLQKKLTRLVEKWGPAEGRARFCTLLGFPEGEDPQEVIGQVLQQFYQKAYDLLYRKNRAFKPEARRAPPPPPEPLRLSADTRQVADVSMAVGHAGIGSVSQSLRDTGKGGTKVTAERDPRLQSGVVLLRAARHGSPGGL